MAKKITPEAATAVLKVTIALCFSWPLPKSASKFQAICFRTLHLLLCVNVIALIVPSMYTLYNNDYDLAKRTKLSCLLAAFMQIILETTQFALQNDRLQYLIAEMEHSLEHAEPRDREIYQRYTDRCVMYHAAVILAVFLTAVSTSMMPLIVADQAFPTDVRYPFDVEHEPVRTLIFLHQFLVIWQCFSAACLCNFIGLLIWFAAARFEILSRDYRAVNGVRDIVTCIRQQVKLLRYTQEVIVAVRSVLLSIIIICTCAFITSGLTIISRSTFADKTQFMILWITGLMEVFACVWPADYLIDASSDIAQAIYESPWYNQDASFQRNVCFILLRSQTPAVVSVSSILPAVSLNYYASYVSTAFSYLMTLRIVFAEDDFSN